MGIRYLHAVNFHEDEVVQLVNFDGMLEAVDDFSNRSSFPGPRRSGYVDAVTRAVRYRLLQMKVHLIKLFLPTRQACRNRRNMKPTSRCLERRGGGIGDRNLSCGERSKLQ